MLNAIATVLLCVVLSAHARELPGSQPESKERIAVLPFEQKGLSNEETATLTKRLAELLQSTGRFEVMPKDEMLRLFAEAEFKNLESCTYSYCLADAGKVLGVQKVMHGSISRRGKLYTLHLRLIDVRSGEIVHDRKSEYSGEFDQLVSEALPGEAKAASEYSLESNTKWYIVTAAIVVTVGAIYSIYKAFNKAGSSEGTGGGPPSTQ